MVFLQSYITFFAASSKLLTNSAVVVGVISEPGRTFPPPLVVPSFSEELEKAMLVVCSETCNGIASSSSEYPRFT